MSIDKTLIFVDGENLVFRYQEMLKAGRKPKASTIHIPDCFVWNEHIFDGHFWKIKRLSYYTSVVGDDSYVRLIRQQISKVQFKVVYERDISNFGITMNTLTGQFVPFVKKKSSKSRKESVCDIAIAVDVMRACYRDHADTIWIFSGDGDFITLFNEVVHSGKKIYVSAFSSGFSQDITLSIDEFFPLDDVFFEPLETVVEPQATQPLLIQPTLPDVNKFTETAP